MKMDLIFLNSLFTRKNLKNPVNIDRYKFHGVSQRYLKGPVHMSMWFCEEERVS